VGDGLDDGPDAGADGRTLEGDTGKHVLVGLSSVAGDERLLHTAHERDDSEAGKQGNGGVLAGLGLGGVPERGAALIRVPMGVIGDEERGV